MVNVEYLIQIRAGRGDDELLSALGVIKWVRRVTLVLGSGLIYELSVV